MPRRTRDRIEGVEIPADLADATRARGWPDGLLERALEAGIEPARIWGWLNWRAGDAADIERQIAWHQRLTTGDLRGREVTFGDHDAFCDLWANAPEEIGDFEVTTLRGPNGFAQFRLQERVTLQVIADGNVLVACVGWARRNVLVGGHRLSVSYGQALRVHKDYRRMGLGDAVRTLASAMHPALPVAAQYDYARAGNFAVVGWWEKYSPGFWKDIPQRAGEVPGIPLAVAQLPARPSSGPGAAVRRARREDLATCVELVNHTHDAQDLFRPYSAEWLSDRLDEGYWGERVPWFAHVYGWDDYFVLESGGRVRACAGLWDRGRDQRDHFRNKKTGEERTVSHAALMDWGFEPGGEAAMLELVDHLVGRAHALGRTFLLVPADPLPELAKRLETLGPIPETRYLRWPLKDPVITRPYTDLAYW
jgi:GNAT superfamily N-acetyltransferase